MKRIRKGISMLLLIVMIFSTYVVPVSAEESSAVIKVTGTYGQTDARAMLALVNEFRTGNEASYKNPDGTETKLTDLTALTYDYNLEQIAMQRAMEIAISFSHTRPNGTGCETLMPETYTSYGENIVAGTSTPEIAFNEWREDNEDYNGQGHRRNMLSDDFTSIGIGHVVYNGKHYWVQEFGSPNSGLTETGAVNTNKTMEIEVAKDMVKNVSVTASNSTFKLDIGETANIPSVAIQFQLKDTWPERNCNAEVYGEIWTVADSEIVTISNGKITADKVGKTTITANILGETVSVEVEVACEHNWGEGRVTTEPTCTQKGEKTFTCSKCSEIKKEELDMVPHTLKTIPAENATCTTAGSTEGSICTVCNQQIKVPETIPALGHDIGEWTVTTEPTWDTNGERTRQCSRCDYVEKEPIEKLSTGHEHNFTGVETILKEATCTENGEKQIACVDASYCGGFSRITIPALGHEWSEWTVTTEPTWDTNGERTRQCSRCGTEDSAVIPKLSETHEHAFTGEEKIVKEATCTEAGEKWIACFEPNCEEVKKEEIPALGHKNGTPAFNWSENYKSAEAVFTCSVCGEVQSMPADVTERISGSTTIFTATISFEEKSYSDVKMVMTAPEGNESFRIVSEMGIKEIPQDLQDAGFTTEKSVTDALLRAILDKVGYGDGGNSQTYDIKLQVYNADTGIWETASKDNFPKEGLTILLPYPYGTTKNEYQFTVAHMFAYDMNGHKAGEVEIPEVIKTDEGLQFTVNGLSPVMVAWEKIQKEESGTNQSSQATSGSNNNIQSAPPTGDQANLGILLLCMTVSAFLGVSVILRRRKI